MDFERERESSLGYTGVPPAPSNHSRLCEQRFFPQRWRDQHGEAGRDMQRRKRQERLRQRIGLLLLPLEMEKRATL